MDDFETIWNVKRPDGSITKNTFPFMEDEKGLFGRGHQNKIDFALKVNEFDRLAAGKSYNEDTRYTAKHVRHVYAKRLPNNRFTWYEITADTPGAFPLTIILR